MLKGTTPKQTIPVLVLRPIKADDSDDTIVYEDEEVKQPKQEVPEDAQVPEDINNQVDETKGQEGPKKDKKKRTLKVTRYVIRRAKKM